MNSTGSLRSLGVFLFKSIIVEYTNSMTTETDNYLNCPSLNFVFSSGKKVAKLQSLVASENYLSQGALSLNIAK